MSRIGSSNLRSKQRGFLVNPFVFSVNGPPWSMVVSLLHMDSLPFSDQKGRVVTNVGSVTLDTVNQKYGAGCAQFNRTNYLTVTGGTDYSFGTEDYLVEFWIYPELTSQYQYLFSTGSYSTGQLSVRLNLTDRVEVFVNLTAGSIYTINPLSLNNWHHIAVSCASGTTRLFLDGVIQGSTTAFGSITAATEVQIGAQAGGSPFQGKMDDFRAARSSNGYTYNFAVPSGPLPNS